MARGLALGPPNRARLGTMTFLTENSRKLSSLIAVLVVLVVSIGLFFYAASSLALTVPAVGWILLAIIAIGTLGFVWLAWGTESTKPAVAKPAVHELTTTQGLYVALEALTLGVAIVAALVWIAPWMGLTTILVVPFGLGGVSVIALLLDVLSKTGRLAVRWRLFEVGASVFAIVSIIVTVFFLAAG